MKTCWTLYWCFGLLCQKRWLHDPSKGVGLLLDGRRNRHLLAVTWKHRRACGLFKSHECQRRMHWLMLHWFERVVPWVKWLRVGASVPHCLPFENKPAFIDSVATVALPQGFSLVTMLVFTALTGLPLDKFLLKVGWVLPWYFIADSGSRSYAVVSSGGVWNKLDHPVIFNEHHDLETGAFIFHLHQENRCRKDWISSLGSGTWHRSHWATLADSS